MHAHELGTGVLGAGVLKRWPRQMQYVEVGEYPSPKGTTRHDPRGWKQRSRQVDGIAFPRNLDGLARAIANYDKGQRRRSLLWTAGLHGKGVPDGGPETAERVSLELVRYTGTIVATRPEKDPWAVQAVRDCVLTTELLIANAAVDAFTYVPGVESHWYEVQVHWKRRVTSCRLRAPARVTITYHLLTQRASKDSRSRFSDTDTMGAGAERNAPCPCGSGQKFKKCCLNKATPFSPAAQALPPAVLEKLNEGIRNESERRRRFGNVRPLITTTHQGHRFIAVGSRLYFHQEWRTFTDFLLFYVRDVMSRDWWTAEASKKGYERHPILKWHDRFVESSKTAEPEAGGVVSAVPDGLMMALVLLAYDLYVLRDHGKLQDEVIYRLKHRDQFYGARYELFVAATFIRAGFNFAYEDESDTKVKHAEFIATHHESGLSIAVEAKARRRIMKVPFDVASIRPGVRELLVSAAEKKPVHPLVVFLEVNLPPEPTDQPPSWMPHIDAVVNDMVQDAGGQWPFAAVLVTNRPHVYGQPDEPDPAKQFAVIRPHSSPISMDVLESLVNAVTQYGNVPSKFPSEFSESHDETVSEMGTEKSPSVE